jgi:hypothetical protein
MSGIVQDPNSWFYNARVRAGFMARPPLAQRFGFSQDTVYLLQPIGKPDAV